MKVPLRVAHRTIPTGKSAVRPSLAPWAQRLLAPRFTGAPRKRFLFLGVVERGEAVQINSPESRSDGAGRLVALNSFLRV